MSSTDPESNRLLDLRNLLILLVGLAMATGTATVAHFKVRGKVEGHGIIVRDVYVHEALRLIAMHEGGELGPRLKEIKRRPEVRRFVDGLSERLLPLIPDKSDCLIVGSNPPRSTQGWPLASRRAAYIIQYSWPVVGLFPHQPKVIYADRNGLDPFSLLGFVGNVFIHAIPLTLLVAGLSWWVRSWRAKRRARRRGFPIVPLDGEA